MNTPVVVNTSVPQDIHFNELIHSAQDDLLNDPRYASTYSSSLIKREVELESLMRVQGLMREENKNVKAVEHKRESDTSYGVSILRKYIHRTALAIDLLLDKVRSGAAGSNRSSLRRIKDMDSHVIAYLSLKTVVDIISNLEISTSLQNVGFYVGKALENEARCSLCSRVSPHVYEMGVKKVQERNRRSKALKDKYEAFFTMMNRASEGFYGNTPNPELVWDNWSRTDKIVIGVQLLHLIKDVTGLITIAQVVSGNVSGNVSKGSKKTPSSSSKKYSMYRVRVNEDLKSWIKDWAFKTGLMAPLCLPVVIPPRHYTNPFNGGYHTNLVRHFTLVKVNDRDYFKALSHPDVIKSMAPVYEALNHAMDTAWKINKPVLEVMDSLWRRGVEVDCLPKQEDISLPPCPKCGERVGKGHPCFSRDLEDGRNVYRAWSAKASEVHRINDANRSKSLVIHRLLWVAHLYEDDECIYFPYQLDFRGRIYALPNFLNPQGSDHAKGLLTFAHGERLGNEEAVNWLAIHVANTYGNDKLSFKDRIQWTRDNTEMIASIASDPLGTLPLWTNTDSPFCFLAACFEWAGYVREGLEYVSCLPIGQDGTCSGLQHYSAMLRDSIGGSAVNLTPAEKPSDIYRVVAERVEDKLRKITHEDVEAYTLAQEWLNSGLIDRKLTKRAVMTLPYGSTLFSAKDYIYDRLMEVKAKGGSLPWASMGEAVTTAEFNRVTEEEDIRAAMRIANPAMRAVNWIGGLVWKAIHETVVAAGEAMDWLRDMAGVVATKVGKAVSWRTPTGFIVVQRYVETKERRLDTTFSGSAVYGVDEQGRHVEVANANGNDDFRMKLNITEDTDTLDAMKQRTGVAPNFVHSMDASALVFAVNTAFKDYGVRDFALIHDSFGTTATRSAALAEAIRVSFLKMYTEHDVIREFEEQMRQVVEETAPEFLGDLPEPPKKGDLDLKLVLKSLYFFS